VHNCIYLGIDGVERQGGLRLGQDLGSPSSSRKAFDWHEAGFDRHMHLCTPDPFINPHACSIGGDSGDWLCVQSHRWRSSNTLNQNLTETYNPSHKCRTAFPGGKRSVASPFLSRLYAPICFSRAPTKRCPPVYEWSSSPVHHTAHHHSCACSSPLAGNSARSSAVTGRQRSVKQ
jgi:hypothetical protein